MKKNGNASLLIFLLIAVSPAMLYAYIDPGTGSFIFQMLAAAIFGGLFALKIFWKKIVAFFSKNKEKK